MIAAWHRARRLHVSEAACRLGARLGNWNDRANGGHVVVNFVGRPRFERPVLWHAVDRIAGWLYAQPERRRP